MQEVIAFPPTSGGGVGALLSSFTVYSFNNHIRLVGKAFIAGYPKES